MASVNANSFATSSSIPTTTPTPTMANSITHRDGTTLGLGGAMAPLNFFKNILLYIFVLILAILFYKITFCFPLLISLILLRVMLYSQTFL